ncbi:MAG: hypothetical protein AAB956_00855 [Patescibacteria group bacterium]
MPYSLLVQKQPGSVSTDFISRLQLPENMEIILVRPINNSISRNDWQAQSDLRQDSFWAALIEQK